jgi:hypothetical protein
MERAFSSKLMTHVVMIGWDDLPLLEDEVINAAYAFKAFRRGEAAEGDGFIVAFPDHGLMIYDLYNLGTALQNFNLLREAQREARKGVVH